MYTTKGLNPLEDKVRTFDEATDALASDAPLVEVEDILRRAFTDDALTDAFLGIITKREEV